MTGPKPRQHFISKCGFICQTCRQVEWKLDVLQKLPCNGGHRHPEIVYSSLMCHNCHALSEDLASFKLQPCSGVLEGLSDRIAYCNACRSPPSPSADAAENHAPAPKQPAPPVLNPEPADLLTPTAETNKKGWVEEERQLLDALGDAQQDLDQLLLLQALYDEQAKLESLVVQKQQQQQQQQQALKAMVSRHLADAYICVQ